MEQKDFSVVEIGRQSRGKNMRRDIKPMRKIIRNLLLKLHKMYTDIIRI